ncbi:hypothetical protein MsAg5_09870 [Methanosarcinaceae archaeon Ag5]|uniref:Uncharacterized protein n=1 Tax=Methanolapillus africanus TaxID=3028297 RepID=A0AAE4SE01_9EURY|nr:hypothetical protein [Methanosarcinaceae archaeon Ag5]
MKSKYSILIAVAVILLMLAVLPAGADAEEINFPNVDYSTLADAVRASKTGDVITITQDITIYDRLYIVDKNITIQGANQGITITRGQDFNMTRDNQRGYFNPGMLEVAVSNPIGSAVTSKVTLKNITFDDASNPDAANHTNSTPTYADGDSNPGQHVYDSVLSAYDTKASIVMGQGARITNPGGSTAIVLTNGANCVMEDGSTIDGNINSLRGGSLIRVENNANLTFNATIKDLNTGGKNIIYAGSGSSIKFYGNISNCNLSHAIQLGGAGTTLTLQENSKISGNDIAIGAVYVRDGPHVDVYGEVSNNTCRGDNGGGFYIYNSSGALFSSGNVSNNTVNHSGNGGGGGGFFINQDSTVIMHGGLISGNHALGNFKYASNNGDYGGGGVSVGRGCKFTMNGGTISNNDASVGGGVFVNGRATDILGGRFIFNGGTITGNAVTDSTNATYGKDLAVAATAYNTSSENKVGSHGGHSIFISKNAVVGDKLIGVAIRDPLNANNNIGYHQAVSVENLQSSMLFGTLNATQTTYLSSKMGTERPGYTEYIGSLWVDSKSAGSFNFTTTIPEPAGGWGSYDILAIVSPLNSTSEPVGTPQYPVPSRTSDDLQINVTKDAAAVNGYAVVIVARADPGPLDLTYSHEGNGEFYFSDLSLPPATLNLGESIDLDVKPARDGK